MNPKLKLAGAALAGVLLTVAAGGIASAVIDKGLGPIGNADLDGNGEITRAEWLQKSGAGFDRLDANKDGKLIVGEIPSPRGPHGPGRRGHGHGGPGFDRDADWDRDDAPDAAPAPATAPAAAPVQNATAPVTQK